MTVKDYLPFIPAAAKDYEINDGIDGITKKPLNLVELRRWGKPFTPLYFQHEIIKGIKTLLTKDSVQGLISLPTGTGKTLTASQVVLETLKTAVKHHESNILWIAPQKELLLQASEALQAAWWSGLGPSSLDIKIVDKSSSLTTLKRPTCLLMTPIMAKNLSKNLENKIGVSVFDEAHHAAAEIFKSIWSNFTINNSHIKLSLGLSATPSRENYADLQALHNAFGSILFIPSSLRNNPIATLIQDNILANPIYCEIPGVQTFYKRRGAQDKRSLRSFVLDQKRWDAIIDCLQNRIHGKTVIYAINRTHGEFLTKHLRFLGLKAEYVDGLSTLGTRFGVFERFRNGDTKIIVNVALMIEGIDCPAAENILLTYPTQSNIKLKQMIGRVLRGPAIGGTKEGKVWAIDGSQDWLNRILFRGDYRFSGWKVVELS